MADPVLQTVALGAQWQTVDPFLFCVHHDDAYPSSDGELAPAASLAGRQLGSDFSYQDGWSMYHGRRVPGFPAHPHRGFETITYVRRGLVDHADSLGAAARYGRGDTQWLTAGEGIVHAEMFPLLDAEAPNPLELFQIWLNLPADDKMVDAHFTMLWDAETPRLVASDDAGRSIEVTVVAGRLGELVPPSPPPSSWASRPEADVAVWHLRLDPGAEWTLPAAAGPDTVRTLYLFEGSGLSIGGHDIGARTGAVVRCDEDVLLTGGPDGSEVLMLQGRPIGEPVAQYGPFVMNDRAGIEQAFADYQRTGFGGWPWPAEDPTHGDEPRRFARHADGRVEDAPATPTAH
ncbi:MAG: pirin family protein [Actinomycetota bacterium]